MCNVWGSPCFPLVCGVKVPLEAVKWCICHVAMFPPVCRTHSSLLRPESVLAVASILGYGVLTLFCILYASCYMYSLGLGFRGNRYSLRTAVYILSQDRSILPSLYPCVDFFSYHAVSVYVRFIFWIGFFRLLLSFLSETSGRVSLR